MINNNKTTTTTNINNNNNMPTAVISLCNLPHSGSLTMSFLYCPGLQSTVAQASSHASHCILFPPKLPSPRTSF